MTGAELGLITEAHERRCRIREGVQQVTDWLAEVTAAYVEGDWRALSYKSWDGYCDDVIGARLRLPIGERREVVLTMRAAGMPTRAIAGALGVAKGTVDNDLGHLANSGQSATPERVTSLDGRERPGTQPASKPREVPPPPPGVDPDTGVIDDPPPLASGRAPAPPRDQTQDEARAISREVMSRHIARSVNLLAGFSRRINAAEYAVEQWDPTVDIYQLRATAAHMKDAAAYLTDLADRWPH